MKNKVRKEKKSMSYQAKWLLTLITMVIAMTLVISCISQGMFHFEKGSVKANDKEEPMVTEEVQDDSDEDAEQKEYTVFVSEGNGGSANPSGKVKVDAWGSVTISFTPSEGYEIQNVVIDGADCGALSSYTLSYVTSDHTIMVTFEKIPEPTPEPTPEPSEDIPEGEPEN